LVRQLSRLCAYGFRRLRETIESAKPAEWSQAGLGGSLATARPREISRSRRQRIDDCKITVAPPCQDGREANPRSVRIGCPLVSMTRDVCGWPAAGSRKLYRRGAARIAPRLGEEIVRGARRWRMVKFAAILVARHFNCARNPLDARQHREVIPARTGRVADVGGTAAAMRGWTSSTLNLW
jgi:hypothetical protein